MLEVGRVCIKLAGREARKVCCVVEKVDNKYVIIEGDVKKRKCNISHLEPLDKVLDISKGKIRDLLEKEGYDLVKKGEKRESKDRPKKIKKVKPKKEKKVVEKKEVKEKKEEVKEEVKEVKEKEDGKSTGK